MSPAIAAALESWKRGYSPTEFARRHFRGAFRNELEAELAHLLLRLEGADELQAAELARQFAERVGRLDAQLRRHLAGDRYPGDDQAAPTRRTA